MQDDVVGDDRIVHGRGVCSNENSCIRTTHDGVVCDGQIRRVVPRSYAVPSNHRDEIIQGPTSGYSKIDPMDRVAARSCRGTRHNVVNDAVADFRV